MAFERYRLKNGRLIAKYGDLPVRKLRRHYGRYFAYRCGYEMTPSDAIRFIDELSLGRLVKDYEAGKLEMICEIALLAA